MSAPVPSGAPQASNRIPSVDILRGFVMILMALDHVRDYFHLPGFAPTDLERASSALFLTRWVTHLCAPVFVFLAGTSAYLSLQRSRDRRAAARFLALRGAWLVLLEVTLVRFAWYFNLGYDFVFFQVIWVIGVSMIVLAGLVFLPMPAITALGAFLVAGHNLLDPVVPGNLGGADWLWKILHEGGWVRVGGGGIDVIYPLVPWPGVMALGFAFGRELQRPVPERRRRLLVWGVLLTVAFVALRAYNGFGSAAPWSHGEDPLHTVWSFLNTTKYPPSLVFLLMTLGPSLLLMAAFVARDGRWAEALKVYGQVPLFFYVVHIAAAHALAVGVALVRYGEAGWWFRSFSAAPGDWSMPLAWTYLFWAVVVVGLYPACRWYRDLRLSRRYPILRWL